MDVNIIEEDLAQACEALRQGKLILYPTDTVWGIGCDATCSDAVRRIYDLKHRADSKALILLVADMDQMEAYTSPLSDKARRYVEECQKPGHRATTIVLPGARGVAQCLLAEDGSVGMRISREEFSGRLCRMFGYPVVSTSANISGHPAAASYADITEDIISGVDYVCRWRRDDIVKTMPSRVVRMEADGTVTVLRD